MLAFVQGGKPEDPEKNPQSNARANKEQSHSTYTNVLESNAGHIGVRRALSPLPSPCSPRIHMNSLSSTYLYLYVLTVISRSDRNR